MKVKVFDEQHEDDLTDVINIFIGEKNIQVIDIKFATSCCIQDQEQIYCFSALLLYEEL